MLLVVGCSEQPASSVDSPKNLSSGSAAAVAPVPASPATAPAAAAVKPYVLHMPGVSGTSIVDYTLREGLRKGGFDGPFVIFDWTCHDPGIPALHNRARNEEQAAIAAELLVKQYRTHPEQPIYLICHSGGSGPAIWALERLPGDVKVACFVMLAPALSPTYDLSKGLSHVSGAAYCFNSPDDDMVLGTGTNLFGTMDGVRCDAAGRVGFVKPPDADEKQYAKLVHKTYDPKWARYGHIGGHIGCTGTVFVQAIVAPLMLGKEASKELLEKSVAQPLPDVLWPK